MKLPGLQHRKQQRDVAHRVHDQEQGHGRGDDVHGETFVQEEVVFRAGYGGVQCYTVYD